MAKIVKEKTLQNHDVYLYMCNCVEGLKGVRGQGPDERKKWK